MLYITIISILIVLCVVLPILFEVAYFTLGDRKIMGSMHRRLGPNIVGSYGFLQPFADALKLLLKEYILPNLSNKILFILGPYITLVFSLLSSGVVCYGPGLSISDFFLGIIYMLATYSLSTYGILLSG
jgi:NADH-ubiquinone oxidoreductase chain 1